jgi:hypothetical protein
MRLRVAENNSKDKDLSRALYMSLGFRPKNIDLYKKAFRHRSAAKETEDSMNVWNSLVMRSWTRCGRSCLYTLSPAR